MDNHAIEVKVTLIENIARNDLDAVIYDLDHQHQGFLPYGRRADSRLGTIVMVVCRRKCRFEQEQD